MKFVPSIESVVRRLDAEGQLLVSLKFPDHAALWCCLKGEHNLAQREGKAIDKDKNRESR